MNASGGRDFAEGDGRPAPIPKPRKPGDKTIFLADYNGPIEPADTVRPHPANEKPIESLEAALERHSVAIGYGSTALVTAALMGLQIVCKDKQSIMSNPNWLNLLPYADWHYLEIASGECLTHLLENMKCDQAD